MLENIESLIEHSVDSDAPLEDRQPNLRANIIGLVSPQFQCDQFHERVPSGIECQCFTDPGSVADAISSSVAVIIVSLDYDAAVYRELVQETLTTSSHIQIALLAREDHDIPKQIPNDEVFTPPFDPESVKEAIARLYIRAYYSSTLEAFYELNIKVTSYRMQLKNGVADDTERLERLEKATDVLESHVKQFRDYLRPEDVRELWARNNGLREFLQQSAARFDPAVLGLPSACPECGLDWTVQYGSKLGNGFERIAANTWRCTRCSHVIANPGAANKFVT